MATKERITSPKGYAQYAHLVTPDTKFNSDGVYSVTLHCDDTAETTKLIERLEAIRDDFYENSKDVQKAIATRKQVVKADVCEWTQDGFVAFKFKQQAKIKCRDGSVIDAHIAMYDAKLTPMSEEVGRDSVIRISFTANPYYMPTTRQVGLSLRPVAVQVIDLKKGGGNSGESYGFEAEEGFEVEDAEEKALDNYFDEVESEEPVCNRGDF